MLHSWLQPRKVVQSLDLHCEYEKHTGCVNTVQWSADGSTLVSSGDDCAIGLWQGEQDGLQLKAWVKSGHRGNVFAATTLPYREKLTISGGADGDIRLCHVDAGSGVYRVGAVAAASPPRTATTSVWRCHRGAVHDIAAEDQNTFLSAASDGTLRLYDLRVEHSCTSRHGHGGGPCTHGIIGGGAGGYGEGLNSLAVHPTERTIVYAAGSGGIVRAYDRRMPHVILKAYSMGRRGLGEGRARAPPPTGRSITSITVSADGEWLGACYTGHPAVLWRLRHSANPPAAVQVGEREAGEEAAEGVGAGGGGRVRTRRQAMSALAARHRVDSSSRTYGGVDWCDPPAPTYALALGQGVQGLRQAVAGWKRRRLQQTQTQIAHGPAAASEQAPTESADATTSATVLPGTGSASAVAESAAAAADDSMRSGDSGDELAFDLEDSEADDEDAEEEDEDEGLGGGGGGDGDDEEEDEEEEEEEEEEGGGSSQEQGEEGVDASNDGDGSSSTNSSGYRGLTSWQFRWAMGQGSDAWAGACKREVLSRHHVHARGSQGAGEGMQSVHDVGPVSLLSALTSDGSSGPLCSTGLVDPAALLPSTVTAGGKVYEGEGCVGGRACSLAASRQSFLQWEGVSGEWLSRIQLPDAHHPTQGQCSGHVNIRTVKQLAFLDPWGMTLAAGSDDGFLYCYDCITGEVLRVARADRRILNGLAPRWPGTGGGTLGLDVELVTSGIDSSIKLWRPGGAMATCGRTASVLPASEGVRRVGSCLDRCSGPDCDVTSESDYRGLAQVGREVVEPEGSADADDEGTSPVMLLGRPTDPRAFPCGRYEVSAPPPGQRLSMAARTRMRRVPVGTALGPTATAALVDSNQRILARERAERRGMSDGETDSEGGEEGSDAEDEEEEGGGMPPTLLRRIMMAMMMQRAAGGATAGRR